MESGVREERWNRWHIQQGSSPRTQNPSSFHQVTKQKILSTYLAKDLGFQSNVVILCFVPSCTKSTTYRPLLYKS